MTMRRALTAFFLLFQIVVGRPAAASDDLVWGVNGHPFTAYPGIAYAAQLDHVRALGMKTYRVNISSLDHEAGLNHLVTLAKQRGIDILPVLTPALDLAKSDPATLYKQAHAFAVYFVSRFKADLRVWELGNEMEVFAIIQPCEMQDDGVQYNCGWGPAGGVGPLEYYGPRWTKVSAVLKGLSEGAKSADPTVQKAMGTAGWGHVGAFERMRNDGIEWDISVWHMYGEDPEWAFKTIAGYGKPIWVTEVNHPRGSEASELDQAKGLRSAMSRLRELRTVYRVEAAQIYELLDEPYWAPDFEAVMGLVRIGKEGQNWAVSGTKPAYCVIQAMVRSAKDVTEEELRGCHTCLAPPVGKSSQDKTRYSYCLLLGRSPDGQGLLDWSALLANGGRVEDVLMSMIQSEEFRKRHRLAELEQDEYVALIYRLLLGREPDGQGRSDYVAALQTRRTSQGEIARSLILSDEFRIKHRVLF
jgi:hypothetical protein